jgi:hypothetical protein
MYAGRGGANHSLHLPQDQGVQLNRDARSAAQFRHELVATLPYPAQHGVLDVTRESVIGADHKQPTRELDEVLVQRRSLATEASVCCLDDSVDASGALKALGFVCGEAHLAQVEVARWAVVHNLRGVTVWQIVSGCGCGVGMGMVSVSVW